MTPNFEVKLPGRNLIFIGKYHKYIHALQCTNKMEL